MICAPAGAYAEVLDPLQSLSFSEQDHSNHGIRIQVLQDVVLESFVYNDQQKADLVQLRLTGTDSILESAIIPWGFASTLVTAGWELEAGSTYDLFGTTSSNGKYCFACAPNGNSHIFVTNGFFGDNDFPAYWADFTNLTTSVRTASVPEPASLVLFAIGLAGLAFSRRISAL